MREATLAGVLLGFAALASLFGLLERFAPAVPRQKLLRPGYLTDLLYWFTTPFLTRAVTRIGVVLALVPLFWLLGRPLDAAHLMQGFGPVAEGPTVAQAAAMIVLGDFVGYWLHRGFHRGWLWRVHAVHHSSEQLDWLAAVRVHPLNDLIARVVQAVVLLGIGFSPLAVAAYQPFLTLYAIFLHANLRWDFGPLRYLVATPAFHRWHHSAEGEARDRNFAGLLPLWDWLFGTLHLPHGQHATRFGISGPPLPTSWWEQMRYPFRRVSSAGMRDTTRT